MQQRQLRLGDILDDYCPRERRLTNHAVVVMMEEDVIRTRCTTCDAEHEYKHAKVPRQRRKAESLPVTQAPLGAPKRVVNERPPVVMEPVTEPDVTEDTSKESFEEPMPALVADSEPDSDTDREEVVEEGPVHRPLIRATLPRQEGRVPVPRQGPDFTIRQPSSRAARFRHQQPRGPQFSGNQSNGNVAGGPPRGAASRHGGRPVVNTRPARRHGPGRNKRSK